MTEMTDDKVKALLNGAQAKLLVPTKALKDAAPDLARALLEARADLATSQESVTTLQRMHTDGCRELAAARAQIEALQGALTPSGETKAAYMGEIKDPETKRTVSWTAIKMVMAMIAARAALPAKEGEE